MNYALITVFYQLIMYEIINHVPCGCWLGGWVVQWLAQSPPTQKVPGSNPAGPLVQKPSCELVQLRLEKHTPQLVGSSAQLVQCLSAEWLRVTEKEICTPVNSLNRKMTWPCISAMYCVVQNVLWPSSMHSLPCTYVRPCYCATSRATHQINP